MHVSCEPDLDRHGRCPNCNSSWDGGDIFDTLRGQAWCADTSDDDLRDHIFQSYGRPPYRWSRLIGVEIQEYYDGVSYWMCPDCSARWSARKSKVIAG